MFWRSIKAIVLKDIVSEFRSRETLPTMIVLGMLLVWVLRIMSEAGMVERQAMAPMAIWIAFLFAGLIAQEHAFAIEQEGDCISALLLAPFDAGYIYLAKVAVNILLLTLFEIILVPLVLVIFDVSVKYLVKFLIILWLGNLGISAVGTLFSAMVQVSRVRGSLLSVLVLVVMLPLMIPASFALLYCFGLISDEVLGSGALSMVGSIKSAVSYLLVFDVVFITAGWLCFDFIIRE